MSKAPKKPNQNHENCQKLVETFLRKDTVINWAREIKMAKKLLADYPQLASWNGIPDENRVYSLSFFNTPNGKKFLEKFQVLKDFEFSAPTSYHIDDRVYGENKVFPKKPTSIFDFIGYGKK